MNDKLSANVTTDGPSVNDHLNKSCAKRRVAYVASFECIRKCDCLPKVKGRVVCTDNDNDNDFYLHIATRRLNRLNTNTIFVYLHIVHSLYLACILSCHNYTNID